MIIIFTLKKYRWIFWYDSANGVIERVGVDGQGRAIIKENLSSTCIQVITLEYASSTIFWANTCTQQLESVRLDGMSLQDPISINLFSSGMCVFEGFIYWTEARLPASMKRANVTTGAPIVQVSSNIFSLLGDLDIVHPIKQPNGEHLRCYNFTI